MIRSAPSCLAASTASRPTAPSPTTATVLPGPARAATAPNQPVPCTSEAARKLGIRSSAGTPGVATSVQSVGGTRSSAAHELPVDTRELIAGPQISHALSEAKKLDHEMPGLDRLHLVADLLDDAQGSEGPRALHSDVAGSVQHSSTTPDGSTRLRAGHHGGARTASWGQSRAVTGPSPTCTQRVDDDVTRGRAGPVHGPGGSSPSGPEPGRDCHRNQGNRRLRPVGTSSRRVYRRYIPRHAHAAYGRDVDHRQEVREFRVSRRARITPEQAGLPRSTFA